MGTFLAFSVCVAVGTFTALPDQQERTSRPVGDCTPVHRHASIDAEGWDMLLDQGYTINNTTGQLMPPGCEGTK